MLHFFKYSRALAPVTGRRPEATVDGPAFDALLPDATLGSRETAARVGALIAEDQRAAPGAERVSPYLEDLLAYQRVMMEVEAGPRDWSGRVEPPRDRSARPVEIVAGTTVLEVEHDLPAVLAGLGRPTTVVPFAPRRSIRLLVARTPRGRVSVVHATEQVTQLLALADGRRTSDALASEAGVPPDQASSALAQLAEIGAIRFPAEG